MPVTVKLTEASTLTDLTPAVEAIQRGGLVVFPTDTLYALGCDGFNPHAVRALARVKRRPADKPFALLVPSVEAVGRVAAAVSDEARRLMDTFWPGGLTIILPRHPDLPEVTVGGGATVGVRQPNDRVAVALMALSGCLLCGPSANLGGEAAPSSVAGLAWELIASTDVILDRGERLGQPSTLIDLTTQPYRLLREGVVTRERLREVLGAA